MADNEHIFKAKIVLEFEISLTTDNKEYAETCYREAIAKLWTDNLSVKTFDKLEKLEICEACGSAFESSYMVTDPSEGRVCKGCFENRDKCRGGHVGK